MSSLYNDQWNQANTITADALAMMEASLTDADVLVMANSILEEGLMLGDHYTLTQERQCQLDWLLDDVSAIIEWHSETGELPRLLRQEIIVRRTEQMLCFR